MAMQSLHRHVRPLILSGVRPDRPAASDLTRTFHQTIQVTETPLLGAASSGRQLTTRLRKPLRCQPKCGSSEHQHPQ